ncbi:MAG TPA: alpha/beta fold hydrolase [Solirubrobacteraceae bacterium]|nr:alpha/beta fold hydrolase [Solirubrobacteraceae bacterium]
MLLVVAVAALYVAYPLRRPLGWLVIAAFVALALSAATGTRRLMNVELHHEIEGPAEAPVVLLASSLGTNLEVWDAQVPALAERLRVVRFDHRGHGRSPVPPGPYEIGDLAGDVLALMDGLGVQRAHFCGLSDRLHGRDVARDPAAHRHRADPRAPRRRLKAAACARWSTRASTSPRMTTEFTLCTATPTTALRQRR